MIKTLIHDKDGWPEFTWDTEALASKLAEIRHRQGLLLGRLGSLGFELRQESRLLNLTTDIVKSSAIEGESLNPEEVRSSIATKLGLAVGCVVPVGRHVDGIVELMLDATGKYHQPLTEERLFGWHAALFPTGWNTIQRITVGNWRPDSAGPMQVVSGPIGREKVHYEAPDASRLSTEMAMFIDWFNSPCESDPVLKAGIAHLWFVTIHPFEDGNGRIGRAIADMAMSRADETGDRFYSMSGQIGKERKIYYDVLESQQRNSLDITDWLDWFLSCLGRALDRSETSLASVLHKAAVWEIANREAVNERQRRVLNRMLGEFEGFINTAKYAKLAKCSNNTAFRDISNLVDRGVLIQNSGGGRSTSYRLPVVTELSC